MDKIYDYPVNDIHDVNLDALHEERRPIKESLFHAQEDLKAALKSQKRSPAKWTPIVTLLETNIPALESSVQLIDDRIAAYNDARRAERRAIRQEVMEAVLREFGQPFDVDTGVRGIRLGVANDPDHDILIWDNRSYNGYGLEVSLVKAGTNEKVFGYEAQVYGPEESWNHSMGLSADTTVAPAYASWGSYSGIKAALTLARTAIMINETAIYVAELTNQAFGIEEGTVKA